MVIVNALLSPETLPAASRARTVNVYEVEAVRPVISEVVPTIVPKFSVP